VTLITPVALDFRMETLYTTKARAASPRRKTAPMKTRRPRGVTLVELMVAVAILTLGILGFFGAFRFITKGIFVSRARTLATNLAQEKVESLKNLSYYALLITTASAVDSSFSPPITYDTANYPSETIEIGGITFTRYTFVSLAQIDNNVISTVSYTYPDTGMKRIMVHILWNQEGTPKKWTLSNLLENPNVNPLDASISGTVTRSGGGSMGGVVVKVLENPDWNATTDASGSYTFRVYHGSYTVRASSAGFYDANSALANVQAGANATVDLALSAIASGTITGNAWLNPGVVISQVVAATNTRVADGSDRDVEYAVLFNPTTYPINVGSTGSYPKDVSINYYDESAGFNRLDAAGGLDLTHVSTYIPPGRYYLIANATSFVAAGSWINADAYYQPLSVPCGGALYCDVIRKERAGAIRLANALGSIIDTAGWDDSNNSAPVSEGTALPLGSVGFDGIAEGDQIVRVSSPGASASVNAGYGQAYDSGDNRSDFLYPYSGFSGLVYAPKNTASAAQAVIAGVPAVGARVASSDPLSGSTQAYSASLASGTLSLLYAPFSLTGVSTGTWSVIAASGTYYKEVSGVAVSAGQNTGIPNAATTPAWTLSGHYGLSLDSSTIQGFLEGTLTDISGSPLSGIQILAAGITGTTGANGAYFASASSGPVTVVANPNNLNPFYTQAIAGVTLESGQIATQNFTLVKGGALQGFLTTGTTPLPNILVTANIGGSQYGSGASGSSGYFTLRNLSTATFTVQPVLDPGQDSSPNSITATVSSTMTVFIGTFTVTGAFGNIRGSVTNSGTLVTTGALILASTATISSPPPLIAGSSAPAQTPLYAVSSLADGTYLLPVRGGATPYKLSAFIPVIAPDGSVTVTTKTFSGISVSPSADTSFNITLP